MSGHNPELWKRNEPILQTDFLVREKIPTWLGDVSGKRILDAGCGEGYVARKLKNLGAIVEGFDNDPEMIKLAKKAEEGIRVPIRYKIGELAQVDSLYPVGYFDIAVISGVVCFLDEQQLFDCISKIYGVIKPEGVLLIATNHTDSYFKRAKSHWLEYLTEPDPRLDTQKLILNFNHPNEERLFTGECYIHTQRRIKEAMQKAGFKVTGEYAPLATRQEMKKHSHMWGNEDKIPYHLIVMGKK
ncbi:MAG: class I SAM-dependent methyltransferase [Nanoarchaeota archaeon]|nr:class I SAM-dependent methyltransferase [Nanoarchaeota archaeon]